MVDRISSNKDSNPSDYPIQNDRRHHRRRDAKGPRGPRSKRNHDDFDEYEKMINGSRRGRGGYRNHHRRWNRSQLEDGNNAASAMETARFTRRNEPFACENCQEEIPPADKGIARNHCPHCLYSKHVDINPGDRANPCQGLMEPIGMELGGKDGYILTHRCLSCDELSRNRSATQSTVLPDSFDAIINLSRRTKIRDKQPLIVSRYREDTRNIEFIDNTQEGKHSSSDPSNYSFEEAPGGIQLAWIQQAPFRDTQNVVDRTEPEEVSDKKAKENTKSDGPPISFNLEETLKGIQPNPGNLGHDLLLKLRLDGQPPAELVAELERVVRLVGSNSEFTKYADDITRITLYLRGYRNLEIPDSTERLMVRVTGLLAEKDGVDREMVSSHRWGIDDVIEVLPKAVGVEAVRTEEQLKGMERTDRENKRIKEAEVEKDRDKK